MVVDLNAGVTATMFLDILVGLTQTFLETLLVIIAATNTPLILGVLLISIYTCPMFRLISSRSQFGKAQS